MKNKPPKIVFASDRKPGLGLSRPKLTDVVAEMVEEVKAAPALTVGNKTPKPVVDEPQSIQQRAKDFAHSTPIYIAIQECPFEDGILILQRSAKAVRVFWCNKDQVVRQVYRWEFDPISPTEIIIARRSAQRKGLPLQSPLSTHRKQELNDLIATCLPGRAKQAPGPAKTSSLIYVKSRNRRGVRLHP